MLVLGVMLTLAAFPSDAGLVSDPAADIAQAKALQAQGRFQESKLLLEQVVAKLSRARPRQKDLLFDAQNSLATAYRRHGDPQKAISILEPLVKEAWAWKDPRAGALLSASQNNLATAYRFVGRQTEARRIWEQLAALDDETAALALDNLTSLMLDSDLDDKQLAAAADYARRSNELWARLEGTDSTDYAISLAVMGGVELRRRDFTLARTLLERSAALQRKLRGPAHPDVAGVLINLGVTEYADGHRDLARAYFREALIISEKSLAADHPQIQEARDGLKLVDQP